MVRLTPLKRKKFEKFLTYIGCQYKRQKGDHIIYDRNDLKRPVVFTTDTEIPIFIIRNNLRTLGISIAEFFDIMKRI